MHTTVIHGTIKGMDMPAFQLLSAPIILICILFLQNGNVSIPAVGEAAGLAAIIILLFDRAVAFVKWLIERRSKFSTESLLQSILLENQETTKVIKEVVTKMDGAAGAMNIFAGDMRRRLGMKIPRKRKKGATK